MIKVIGTSKTIVETADLKIDELVGNATTSTDEISVARVTAKAGASEPWLTLHYDEYISVLEGTMKLLVSDVDDDAVVVKAGDTVFIPKGSRFKPTFPESTSYIPVCLPAFRPDRCIREDTETVEGKEIARKLNEHHSSSSSSSSSPPNTSSEPKPEVLYHMCPKDDWETCASLKSVYYPKTYAEDGYYTHATGVPSRLISTANHYYTSSPGDWICLTFTRSSLYKRGIHVKDEKAMPVGTTAVNSEWTEWVCPHVMGGLLPEIVDGVFEMERSKNGAFLSIKGLAGAE